MRIPGLGGLFVAACAVWLLSACSATPTWISGSWKFDQAQSEKVLRATPGARSGSNLADGFNFSMRQAALDQEGLIEVRLLGRELTTIKDGRGHVDKFRVAQANDNECSLQFSDNSIEAFYRDGSDVYFFVGSGGGPVKVYLSRQE